MAMSVIEKARAEKKRIEEEKARRNASYWRISKDIHRVRIMPPYDNEGNFFRQFGKHWRIGPEENVVIYCPQDTFAMPCEVCNRLKKVVGEVYEGMRKNPMRKAEYEKQLQYLKEKTSSLRYYVNLVDMDEVDKGVQVGELPQTVILAILDIIQNEQAGYGDITDPNEGFDIFINRAKDPSDKRNTKYSVSTVRTPSAIPAAWKENIVNLDAVVRLEPAERVALLAEGKDVGMSTAVVDTTARVLPPAQLPPAVQTPPVVQSPPESVQETGQPPCFGQFDVNVDRCLNCVDGEDCEDAWMKARRASRKAQAEAASDVIDVAPPVQAPPVLEVVAPPEPAKVQEPMEPTSAQEPPKPATMPPFDDLMATMKAALKGQKAA
jgi:hypothetical protein